ncbi:MAG TPA: IPT/TIG domain-containing protein [Puia sp.]|jgi:hypothetical protein|nr:IPT/TIG domain-containing protein [Puia sp.]
MKKIAIITLGVTILVMSLACRKGSVDGAGIIRSVTPEIGHFGTVVTIRGEGFDSINGYVTIDGAMAPIMQISDTTIVLTVPTTHTGAMLVKRTTGGTTAGPTFTYIDDILVAGWLVLNPGNPDVGGSFAYYWDNGIPFNLVTLLLAGPSVVATGITTADDDIYACGYQYYGLKRYAIVWKNGVAGSLSNITTQDAQPYAIQVAGQNVYVAGYLNNGNHDVATVWVNGQPTALLGDTVNSYANALTIVGNDVYIAGYRAQSNSSNHVALYWKNANPTTLSDGIADASTTGIAVVGTDLYVAGNMGGGILWKDGLGQALSTSTIGLFGNDNSLYLAGSSTGYYDNYTNPWTWGPSYPGYYVGGPTVNAVTADSTIVYTANSGPSYSIWTSASPAASTMLSTVSLQGYGTATAIWVRH